MGRFGFSVYRDIGQVTFGTNGHPINGSWCSALFSSLAHVEGPEIYIHGCQMAIAQFLESICVWPFGLLDHGPATLRCKM